MNALASSEQVPNSGVDAQNPWPGLVAFTEQLQQFFYGRTEEADDLQRRVERKNLTVLFGQSGLGKSSLLYAGLFPRLRAEGYLPVPIRLDHTATSLALSEQVKAAVTRAILETGGRAESAAPKVSDTLWEHFHRRDLCQQMQDGKPVRLILIFDQFEELFAIGQASEETRARAGRFLKELADFIENRAPDALERRLDQNPEVAKEFIFGKLDYRTLVCLREDYLPHLEGLRQLMPSITENRMRLTRMSGTSALEAVLKPGGDLITPEVGRQVVRFVAGGRMREIDPANGQVDEDDLKDLQVEPSLLSLVCRELNGRRLSLGLAQVTADLLAGNRERILQDFYERCVADQPAAVRAFVEDELVTDSGLRENMALERARRTLSQRGAPASAIDELVKRRLLHLEERLDIQRVELTHDVLTSVVKKSRDERQQKEATLRAEQRAEETREKARRQRKRSRLIMATMAVTLVGVIAFGAVSFYQYRVSSERLLEVERQKERAEEKEQDAKKARAEAVKEKETAEENRKLADRHFTEARGTVDGFLTKISREELAGIPGMQKMREQFARDALDRYQRFAKSRPEDREVAEGLARAHGAMAAILGQIGTVENAVKHFNEALAIQRRLLQAEPTSGALRLGVAKSQFDLAQFYWSISDYAKALPLVNIEIPELEKLVADEPANLEARLELAKVVNLLGNVDPPSAKAALERSRDLCMELLNHDFRKVDVLIGLAKPLHNLARYHGNRGENKVALELYRLSHKYEEVARKLAPGSPDIEYLCAVTQTALAGALRRLGQEDDALKHFDEAAGRYRAVVGANPFVHRYRWAFAGDLTTYAQAMSGARKYSESQNLYKESEKLLEELIVQVPDRAMYAIQLIETLEDLSYFHQGSRGEITGKSPTGGKQAEQILYVDRAVAVGRKLSPRFPRDVAFQYRFMEALHRRALLAEDTAALAYYEEMLETFRKGVWEVQQQPDSFELGRMLNKLEHAVDCARRLKRNDKVLEFSAFGLRMGKDCTRIEGIEGLCAVLQARGETLRESGRSAEAIQACQEVVKMGKPALEKAPWHWYIRSRIRQAYRGIAEMHEQAGDFQNEVLAHREYLKVWGGPMQGMKIDKYIDPKNPTDEAEARRLRAFRKLEPSMQNISVPSDANGVKYQRTVYLTNVPYPKDPLEDQAKWLSETFRGEITQDFRESFRTIHKLAHEHKVPFALVGRVVPIAHENKVSVVDLFHYVVKDTENRRTRLKEEADGLEAALAITPDNTAYREAHVKTLAELKALSPSPKVTSTAGGKIVLQSTGKLAKTDPFDKVLTTSHHQVHTLKMAAGASYTMDLESTDFDNYLRLEDSTGKELAKDDDSGGNLNARINHVAAKDDTVRVLVTSYKAGATGSYVLTVRETRTEGLITIAGQVAELELLAKKQRDLVEAHQAKGRHDDYRHALNREFDIRGEQVKLNPTNAQVKEAQNKVASEIARSYLEAKEPGGAMTWIAYSGLSASSESLLELADFLEKGTNIKADPKTASHYRYQAYSRRGMKSFLDRRYKEALPDFKNASDLADATPDDHSNLGICYGKLGQWKEAINAYQRAFDLEPNTIRGTSTMLNLLEAYITSDRPADAERFAADLVKKKWQPKADGTTRLSQRLALFQGLRAIALRILDRNTLALEVEKSMREHIVLINMDQSEWGWQEINAWLTKTTLSPDRKAAVESILAELKGITLLDEKTAFAGYWSNLPTNGPRKVHGVPLKAGKSYQVDVTGVFDTLLRIEDSQDKDLVHNDDVNVLAPDLNSRLIFLPTKDDTYRLIVFPVKAGVVGKYTLKIQEVVKVGKEELTKGELTAKDEKYKDAFAHKHKIHLEAGRPYTMELNSEQYNTRLVLFDPAGTRIAAENAGISAADNRLSRIDFTPKMSGTYVVLVTSNNPGKTGEYTLRVQGYGRQAEK